MSMPHSSNAPRRTLLLTGASRGIGHATVIRFSSAGWRVITCSRHAFPEDCPWDAGPEDHIQVDLGNPADTARAITDIRNRLEGGMLHALVNNAAISPKGPGGSRLGSVDTDLDTWTHVFHVNFFAPIMIARGLIEELKAAKGSVVNVTSIAGSRVHPFAGAAYATSKAALASLTREMASDFGRVGVRVNAIAPGEIDTSILSPGTEKIVDQQIPMHRLGTPDEVAKIIYVLCTDTSVLTSTAPRSTSTAASTSRPGDALQGDDPCHGASLRAQADRLTSTCGRNGVPRRDLIERRSRSWAGLRTCALSDLGTGPGSARARLCALCRPISSASTLKRAMLEARDDRLRRARATALTLIEGKAETLASEDRHVRHRHDRPRAALDGSRRDARAARWTGRARRRDPDLRLVLGHRRPQPMA